MTDDEPQFGRQLHQRPTEVMMKIPDDHPMMIAWEAYRRTEESANSDKWARTLDVSEPMQGQIIVGHPHLVGSLWAAFVAGYKAAEAAIGAPHV